MSELDPIKTFIQEEEVKYKAAISEITGRKLGRMLNFLGRRLHERIVLDLNGPYYLGGTSQTGVSAIFPFEFDAEIFNVYIYNIVAGTSGTTELDAKILTAPGGSGTSIFSTTPKITSSAGNFSYIGVGETLSGCTAPVLTSNPVNVNAGDAIYLDKIQAMSGAQNCGLIIHYRPR